MCITYLIRGDTNVYKINTEHGAAFSLPESVLSEQHAPSPNRWKLQREKQSIDDTMNIIASIEQMRRKGKYIYFLSFFTYIFMTTTLSRSNVPSEEWRLNPQTVQKIWEVFGKAEVDLFTSKDNSHCAIYFSKSEDALAHYWPNLLLYAFPPIALIPQVIRRIWDHKHRVLLVAPLWRNQLWFSELSQLLTAALWPIPLRQDLLSQANKTIWHPQPELWALHLWALDGNQ